MQFDIAIDVFDPETRQYYQVPECTIRSVLKTLDLHQSHDQKRGKA